jgi:hypothetical protein
MAETTLERFDRNLGTSIVQALHAHDTRLEKFAD